MTHRRPAVLLAPDKFKGSLDAEGVAAALERGLREVRPGVDVVRQPIADGGDGTVDALVAAGYERRTVSATGPTGEAVTASWAHRDGTAVVELADACGLNRLSGPLAPLDASSRGLGDVVRDALDAKADRIVMGLGGSASTDGGAGLLVALGAVLRDADGHPLEPSGRHLADVAAADLTGLHPRCREVEFVVASDVDNPLVGPRGAAAVFAPQKGASPSDVAFLERGLRHWADVLAVTAGNDARDVPGAGAAGGVGFAALTVLGAVARSGIDLVLEIVDLDQHLEHVDLVVTGEGSLDEQTLGGKAPAGVAAAARRFGVPTVAVCGRCEVDETQWVAAGFHDVLALSSLEPDPARSMRDAAALLERLGQRLAARLS
ncbi:glycerate kinase [Aeromicrobium phragmitis]|uniref:Glycerate kinase n=1 Tax=Aeromicrobium phragmitis TaxID=2478914 RepID=A0A3L8PP25_9ACTN|nr:glycerate kinase [Aeromicrobium phragmitis]RLV55752.1 glycerate kinase [Aeromicrobium phragmitis]